MINSKHANKLLFLLIATTVVLVSACSKSRTGNETSGSEKASNSTSADQLNLSTKLKFPHNDGKFSDKSQHGYYAASHGTNECKGCHGAGLTGGNTGKSCYRCHSIYPHTTNFRSNFDSTEFHGTFVLENQISPRNPQALCGGCHGADLKGAQTNVSCNKCHSIFPHSDDFKASVDSADFHGTFVLENKTSPGNAKALCGNCHGADLQGAKTKVSCNKCHTVYPHSDDFTSSDMSNAAFHGKVVLGNGADPKKLCGVCHGTDLQGAKTQVSCYNCHSDALDTVPHSDDFKSGGHKGIVLDDPAANKKPENLCMSCHGQDAGNEFSGGYVGKSCWSCHDQDKYKKDKTFGF